MQLSNNGSMLSIDMNLSFDDSFSLDSSFSSSPPGMSFSSSSSGHGPLTPTSGRSTPASRPGSTEFERSFMSDDLAYTPPSSQGSVDSYFQMELAKTCPSMDMDFDIMTPNGMPATPTRFDSILDHNVSSQSCFDAVRMTPQQPLDNMYALADSLVSPPFMFPTPEQQQPVASNLAMSIGDRSDLWSTICEPDEEPIDFFPVTVVPSNGRSRGGLLSPPAVLSHGSTSAGPQAVSRRLFVNDAQRTTNALQQHLNTLRSQAHPDAPKKSFNGFSKHSRRGRAAKDISVDHVVPEAEFRCHIRGCEDKKYRRMEHLKRHLNTDHNIDTEIYTCEFCNRPFKGRKDNYTSHIALHTKPETTSGRTKYFPAAAAVLARLREQARPRKGKGAVGKRRAGGEAPSAAAVKACRIALAAGI